MISCTSHRISQKHHKISFDSFVIFSRIYKYSKFTSAQKA